MAGACLHTNGMLGAVTLTRSNRYRLFESYKSTMVITMSNNQSYWASINADIEAHLKQAIPVKPPLVVFEPMHHLAFAAPRNTAPALCIAACELVGGHRDQAISAASALHLMHAAAFVHEHLPLTDRPKSKPRPVVHHAFDPNIELLTGDGLVPLGFELLSASDDPNGDNSGRILRVIVEIARATGSQGMVDGRYRKVLCDHSDGEESCHVGWIDHVIKKTDGELHACGAACGAILGGGSEDEIEKLRKYGLYIGMIQGAQQYGDVGREERGLRQRVNELRELALNELNDFDDAKVESISSLVEANLCYT